VGDHQAHRGGALSVAPARDEREPSARGSLAPETIAAVATAPGRAGIGIVRVSGPAVAAIARSLAGGLPPARRAVLREFRDAGGETIDHGLVLHFPAPGSFTGEDVLELHGHGGPVVLDRLLGRVLALGARLARPGEFSERAFLNGRIDLVQAEAVADLIEAHTEAAARAAQRSLAGAFSREVRALGEQATALRASVEAALDFADEAIEWLDPDELEARIGDIAAALEATFAAVARGVVIKEGLTAAIAGRPNVGKSSLLNRLAGRDTAIVTALPGTTRDVLREHIDLDGLPLHVLDTAGLRESADPVEREGVERAWRALREADTVLLVIDDREGIGDEEERVIADLPATSKVIVVRNKIDLSARAAAVAPGPHGPEVRLSALTGTGLQGLVAELKAIAGGGAAAEGAFLARRRHLEALERARVALTSARAQAGGGGAPELLAEDLRTVQRALGEITGEITSEDLLGRIFSTFCIGK